jgi:hypothetical protein
MTVKTKAQLDSQIASLFADNSSGDISALDLRTHMGDEVDSFASEGIPVQTANGAQMKLAALEQEMAALSGASVDSTIEVPIGGELVGVGVRVTTLITGATSFNVVYRSQEKKAPSRFRGALARSTVASGSIAAAGSAFIDFATEDYDTDDFHDNSTNPSRMTIPTGSNITKVRVVGSIRGSTWGAGKIGIFMNGSVVAGGPESRVAATGLEGQFAVSSGAIEVSPGDYFQIRMTNDEASSKTTQGDVRTFMTIEVVEEVEETVLATVAVAANTTGSAVVKSVPVAAATKIRLVANGSNFTAGAVRLAMFYKAVVAPTS